MTTMLTRINALMDELGYSVESKPVTAETKLLHDYGMDSIDVLRLVFAVEHEFAVTMNPNDIDRNVLDNVGGLISLIERKLHASG